MVKSIDCVTGSFRHTLVIFLWIGDSSEVFGGVTSSLFLFSVCSTAIIESGALSYVYDLKSEVYYGILGNISSAIIGGFAQWLVSLKYDR